MNDKELQQGEVWLFDPDPVIGHELGHKVRPALIISNNCWNKIQTNLVIIIPISSVNRNIATHVQIDPPEGGLSATSFALCEQIRTISRERLVKKIGKVQQKQILQNIRSWILDLTSFQE